MQIVFCEVSMRGTQDRQQSMLGLTSIEARIPDDHPLRRIKKMADQELVRLSRVFDRMYSNLGASLGGAGDDLEIAVVDRALLGQERAAVLRAIGLQSFVSLVFGYGTD